MNARKLASFDIQTWDNIRQYQCDNPIISIFLLSIHIIGKIDLRSEGGGVAGTPTYEIDRSSLTCNKYQQVIHMSHVTRRAASRVSDQV